MSEQVAASSEQVVRSLLLAARCSLLALVAATALAQTPVQEPPHDISKVDPAPLGGAISVPLPERERKRLEKYEIPELVGSRQALGSQLIDGRLPHPILDYL